MDENYQGGQHKKKMKKVSAKYLVQVSLARAHMIKGTAKGTTECFCWDFRSRILLPGAGQGGAKDNFWERSMGSNSAEPGRGSNSGWGEVTYGEI